jgi:hypothetical protein
MSSHRPLGGARVLIGVAILALAGVVVAAAIDRRDLAFTPGVPALGPVVQVDPGRQACQHELRAKAAFRAVELIPGPPPVVRGRLAVRVVDSRSGEVLGRGVVPPGRPGGQPLSVRIGKVTGARRIDVCIGDLGPAPVTLTGGRAESVPGSRLTRGSKEIEGYALSLRFLRERPRSVLSQVPLIFRRAALFRPGLVGSWTFWVLAALVALGVPLLLARALADVDPR